jgi:hypothetical protein
VLRRASGYLRSAEEENEARDAGVGDEDHENLAAIPGYEVVERPGTEGRCAKAPELKDEGSNEDSDGGSQDSREGEESDSDDVSWTEGGAGSVEASDEEGGNCVNCAQPLSSCRGEICDDEHAVSSAELFESLRPESDEDGEPEAGGKGAKALRSAEYLDLIEAEAQLISANIISTPTRASVTRAAEHTILAYDRRMTLHAPPGNGCSHDHGPVSGAHADTHPERPHRVAAMYQYLHDVGLARRCVKIGGTEVTEDEVLLVHSLPHWQLVQSTKTDALAQGGGGQVGSDTYYNAKSALCARLASGTVLDVCRRVVRGEAANGVAIVRPPGHHAEAEVVMGFCFFNYVAVAAALLKKEFGLRRILIVDWDVHHGNGTQNMFYDDPHVMYISLHRYDGGTFYPVRR